MGTLTIVHFHLWSAWTFDPLGKGDELLAHSLNNDAILDWMASNLFASPPTYKKYWLGISALISIISSASLKQHNKISKQQIILLHQHIMRLQIRTKQDFFNISKTTFGYTSNFFNTSTESSATVQLNQVHKDKY
jgi:hypothetical protein